MHHAGNRPGQWCNLKWSIVRGRSRAWHFALRVYLGGPPGRYSRHGTTNVTVFVLQQVRVHPAHIEGHSCESNRGCAGRHSHLACTPFHSCAKRKEIERNVHCGPRSQIWIYSPRIFITIICCIIRGWFLPDRNSGVISSVVAIEALARCRARDFHARLAIA